MSIEVANESGIEVDESSLAALSIFVLDALGIHPLAELSILLVDVAEMEQLHVRWMGEPGPTDVLAFPMDELRPGRTDIPPSTSPDDEAGILGDVVLCPEVAARQGEQAGHTMQDELHLLCVHGILHLLGYDHAEPEEEKEMFGLQAELLKSWLGSDSQEGDRS
jgi:probable rRNA maturation factor